MKSNQNQRHFLSSLLPPKKLIGSKEPASVLVVADLASCPAHTAVLEKLLAYLRECGAVDRVYYAR